MTENSTPLDLFRLLVIRNPTAGQRRSRRFRDGLDRLRATIEEVDVSETAAKGDATRIASAAMNVDAVVAAGGDGTINEVISGLIARPGGPLPLGILPLGTANVLANELGLPVAMPAAAATIKQGRLSHIHLGNANGHAFAMMAGVGFDAKVVADLPLGLKRAIGKGAYVWQTARQWLRPLPGPYRVTVGDEELTASAVIGAKGHYYGGRFVLAPKADLRDPSLELCVFLGRGRWAALRALVGLVTGRAHQLSGVRIITARSARIEGPELEPVQADGDIIAHLPVDLSVMPTPLPVIVP
ncbi:MAG: diacylglycerol kinase family protein [Pseudomonadota bacterium]